MAHERTIPIVPRTRHLGAFVAALAFGLALVVAVDARRAAHAQYCAEYDDGTKDCGIATQQMCEQSVSGVGGVCVPDTDKGPTYGPRIMQRLFDPGAPLPAPGSSNLPGSNPSDMPPPPVR
jgi:hypothetical protein